MQIYSFYFLLKLIIYFSIFKRFCFVKHNKDLIKINDQLIINCKNVAPTKQCVDSRKIHTGYFRIAPENNLNVCIIGKNFSSMLAAISCYIFDEKMFKSKNEHLIQDYWGRHACQKLNMVGSFEKVRKMKHNAENFNVLFVARHPIFRFLSSFVHLCVFAKNKYPSKKTCFNSDGNMEIFLSKLYQTIINEQNGSEKGFYHLKVHFYPQTSNCQYNKYKNKFKVINFDADRPKPFYRSLLGYLKKHNVEVEKLRYIKKEMHTTRSYHATHGSEELLKQSEILFNSSKILELVSRIYYDDFISFDYPLPEVNMMEKVNRRLKNISS